MCDDASYMIQVLITRIICEKVELSKFDKLIRIHGGPNNSVLE